MNGQHNDVTWRSNSALAAFLDEYFRSAPNEEEANLKLLLWLGIEIKNNRVMLDTTRGKLAFDFLILAKQGIMRRPKQRIPQHATDSAKRVMVMVRIDAMKSKGGAVRAEE